MSNNDDFQYESLDWHEFGAGFKLGVYRINSDTYIIDLVGELNSPDQSALENIITGLISHTSSLERNLSIVLRFVNQSESVLETSIYFLNSLIGTVQLKEVYLVGANRPLRLAVKLTTSATANLPVFLVDSVKDALLAIGKSYFENGGVPKSIFYPTKHNAKFMDLWQLDHEVWQIGSEKVKVVTLPNWHYESENIDFITNFTIIDGRLLYSKFIGSITYEAIDGFKTKQALICDELGLHKNSVCNVIDISETDTGLANLFRFIFRLRDPELSNFGIIGWKIRCRFFYGFSKWVLKHSRRSISSYENLESAYEKSNKESSTSKKQGVSVSTEYIENENHILENNIKVSREKLFHLIAQMNWHELKEPKLGNVEYDLYKDTFDSLVLMQNKLAHTWEYHQDKSWQLNSNKEKALRTQLDPHFIFNVLNTIRQVILEEDNDDAAELLNDFADFMRLLINNGLEDTIPLTTEVEYLSLYVKLEMLRFEDQFSFNLDMSTEVHNKLAELSLPPLIIQPFIEQAIWERILPANKKLLLELSFSLSDDILLCHIVEKGLSFSQAEGKFKSFGKDRQQRLNSLESRLQLIEEMHGCKITVLQNEITTSSSDEVTSEILIKIPQFC